MKLTNLTNKLVTSRVPVALIALGLALTTTTAFAVILNPGQTVPTTGMSEAQDPNLAGLVIEDTLQPFTMTVNGVAYTGTLQDRVVEESSTGRLDFYYRIMLNNQALKDSGLVVERTSYAGVWTDVNYRTDGLGNSSPTSALRSNNGGAVEFVYGKGVGLLPGSNGSTTFAYIATNAKACNFGGVIRFQFAGGSIVTLRCWQPL
jgi:hypothetical protein